MPKSTRIHHAPDGIYGDETYKAVYAFQGRKDVKLKQDGVVGHDTLLALDAFMAAAQPPSPPAPPPPSPTPPVVTRHYELGTGDPPLHRDPGAGVWGSKPVTATSLALKMAIIRILPDAYVLIGDDAVKHMFHYLGNSGSTYTIDLEGMVKEVPSAKNRFQAEILQAQTFVEMLPIGKHQIRSRMAEGGYNYKNENWNWFYAIGGYSSWGEGAATVKQGAQSLEYELDFAYKFYDRYNWDKGKKVTIFGITVTDEFMAEFHREGLAKEFNCIGSLPRRLTWRKGEKLSQSQIDNPPGGRS